MKWFWAKIMSRAAVVQEPRTRLVVSVHRFVFLIPFGRHKTHKQGGTRHQFYSRVGNSIRNLPDRRVLNFDHESVPSDPITPHILRLENFMNSPYPTRVFHF